MKLVGWFLLFTLFTSTAVFANLSHPTKKIKFLSVADIHFDPFSGCTKKKSCPSIGKLQKANIQEWSRILKEADKSEGAPYKDTNFNLLETLLEQMQQKSQVEKPAFVIILGDFLSHNFREDYMRYAKNKSEKNYQEFVKKTFQFMAAEFSKTFPDKDVYPVIGNNDSYHGDYSSIPNGKFYQDMSRTWSGLIKNKENRNNFVKQFPTAGYYEINVSTQPDQKLIVLNSVLFSIHTEGANNHKAAGKELSWLNEKLTNAAKSNQKVIIAYHIPVGIDVFSTIQNKLDKIMQFWNDEYTNQFEKILKQHQIVSLILSGHIHIDTLQAITLKQFANVPVNITPSVSPIFGNNPAFKIITINRKTLQLLDSDTYYHSLNMPVMEKATSKNESMHVCK